MNKLILIVLKVSILCGIFYSIFIFEGCQTTTTPAKPFLYPESLPPVVYKFDYTPSEKLPYSDITVAIVSPQMNAKISGYTNETTPAGLEDVTAAYINALKGDFEEVIVDKGNKILGPFNNLEDMTYGEREKSILALVPTVYLNVTFKDGPTEIYSEQKVSYPSSDYVEQSKSVKAFAEGFERILKVSGVVQADVSIKFELYEPLTREKMLVRQISIPIVELQSYDYYIYAKYKGYRNFFDSLSGTWSIEPKIIAMRLLNESDYRPRALAKALESVYIQQLEQFSRYFDPKEIAQVKIDAEKVRKLKRY